MTVDTNILLVDDHAMVRKGLRVLIEQEKGFSVIGEATDGREAIDLVRQLQPDIVVMDINMPGINGIEATRQIIAESPQTRVLALTMHSGKKYIDEMLEAGAAGYIIKESVPKELITAIQSLKEGGGYLGAGVTSIVIDRLRQQSEEVNARATDPHAHTMTNKLNKPPLPKGLVHRRELIERLEKGRNKRLSIVVAPAGYGKSTLVCDWLNTHEQSHIWCFLDENDNDLLMFLKSWTAALDTLFPTNSNFLRSLIDAANMPPGSILAGAMVADIDELPQDFVLVLDNMHLIKEKAIYDLLSQVLRQQLKSMHLVMISRRDPFVPILSLRAGNMLNEIRTSDLRFSTQEIQKFLEKALNKTIDSDTAEQWEERTDGWVTGLQLAIHTLCDSDTVEIKPSDNEPVNWRNVLTNREFDVLLLLQQRMRDKEIADQLCISTGTVRTHLKNLYSKLDATNRRDVVVKAEKLQILN